MVFQDYGSSRPSVEMPAIIEEDDKSVPDTVPSFLNESANLLVPPAKKRRPKNCIAADRSTR